jgi:molecular chaperone GrpE
MKEFQRMADSEKTKRDRSKRKQRQESAQGAEEAESFRVDDRRHWMEENAEEAGRSSTVRQPTMIDEFRQRTESAEQQLQDYIDAFKKFKQEQEEFRLRMNRDIDRRVELKFGELVGELLESVDDLDLALQHARQLPEAEPLSAGVRLVRDRFLATLERHGVTPVKPDGEAFDPNEAEAVRMDPVDSPEWNGRVTVTVRPGYRLGERVIRAARVAVGRYVGA